MRFFPAIRKLRHDLSSLVTAVLVMVCGVAPAPAQDYPTKTIQIINPFPPGAVTDIVARIVAPKMSAMLGQQVVIVNKAGGGGAVGIQAAQGLPRRTVTRFSSRRRQSC